MADEPTGNLDSANADAVMNLLSGSLRGQSAVVMVTHDPVIAAKADKTVQLVGGQVVAGQDLAAVD